MQVHFTEALVRSIKLPETGQVYYSEPMKGRSLILCAGKEGKTWSIRFYRNSKPVLRKLPAGDYPAMSLKGARSACRSYDVSQQEASAPQAGAFKTVADEWFKRHVEGNGLRSWRELRRILNAYIIPAWGDRDFRSIRRSDVTDLIDNIVDQRGRSQADSVLGAIRGIMHWYELRHDDYASPIVRGMKRHNGKSRERWLNDQELRAVWGASARMGGAFGGIVRLALLSGQRREKIATLQWGDIKDGYWHVRREEREKGVPQKIKLSPMALEIIDAQPRVANNPWVFPGRHKSYSAYEHHKVKMDAMLPPMERWTLHDLRRTARALMTRARVPNDAAELALGHRLPGAVRSIYDNPLEHDVDAAFLAVEGEIRKVLAVGG